MAEGFDDLMEEIRNGLFDGQVTVTRPYDEHNGSFEVKIAPNGGIYSKGEYVFEIVTIISSGPQINCLTAIFHPNIDITKDDGKLCIDLEPDLSAQDVVEKLLNLMLSPDICNSHLKIDSTDSEQVKEFWDNVENSIAGGKVGHYLFPVNERYAKLHPPNEGESTEVEGWELVGRNFGIKQYMPRPTPDDDGDDDEGNGDDDDDDEE